MGGNDSSPRVVVGVDGSPSSHAALRWALRQAELTGATVYAVGVWEPPSYYGWSAPVVDTSFDYDLARRQFTEQLDEVLGPEHSSRVEERLVLGNPAQVLIDEADGAELLVVGSHGRGTFAAAVLGSVSARCAAHATCPVVIVRSP
ncbi:universal stress protein [Kitasatospora kifunensis]|uniref:Nucleotide-binding universal stress UspA family protein n=1 Tax=Kitasatospora kifunensis TaxID=58351 RepID=A0A7W7R9E6_KITKI|nr:universal stress protein [Kitasatospora kifunensis]MBB4927816.1 nucleotide-binding universal stress UspA family protein [Kitasatospora kifunensis]